MQRTINLVVSQITGLNWIEGNVLNQDLEKCYTNKQCANDKTVTFNESTLKRREVQRDNWGCELSRIIKPDDWLTFI